MIVSFWCTIEKCIENPSLTAIDFISSNKIFDFIIPYTAKKYPDILYIGITADYNRIYTFNILYDSTEKFRVFLHNPLFLHGFHKLLAYMDIE